MAPNYIKHPPASTIRIDVGSVTAESHQNSKLLCGNYDSRPAYDRFWDAAGFFFIAIITLLFLLLLLGAASMFPPPPALNTFIWVAAVWPGAWAFYSLALSISCILEPYSRHARILLYWTDCWT
ncbi:hypothetical protein F5Y09DRAFT_216909 [Xylaria sp. FL1042]|nr:hypothetical protein F5Y09DRAFT_216909 [Xylaria sp. FL1042]